MFSSNKIKIEKPHLRQAFNDLGLGFDDFCAIKPPHIVLGVSMSDGAEVIKEQYKALMKAAHPDTGNAVANNELDVAEISVAFGILNSNKKLDLLLRWLAGEFSERPTKKYLRGLRMHEQALAKARIATKVKSAVSKTYVAIEARVEPHVSKALDRANGWCDAVDEVAATQAQKAERATQAVASIGVKALRAVKSAFSVMDDWCLAVEETVEARAKNLFARPENFIELLKNPRSRTRKEKQIILMRYELLGRRQKHRAVSSLLSDYALFETHPDLVNAAVRDFPAKVFNVAIPSIAARLNAPVKLSANSNEVCQFYAVLNWLSQHPSPPMARKLLGAVNFPRIQSFPFLDEATRRAIPDVYNVRALEFAIVRFNKPQKITADSKVAVNLGKALDQVLPKATQAMVRRIYRSISASNMRAIPNFADVHFTVDRMGYLLKADLGDAPTKGRAGETTRDVSPPARRNVDFGLFKRWRQQGASPY